MGNRRYRISEGAHADLQHIASYIGARNPSAADRVIDVLIGSFSTLADNPEMAAKRDDLRSGLRIYSPTRPAQNYVVLYYLSSGNIEIAAVIHGARDWPELFSRDDKQ
jgi:toxin ParE1/3/4